MTELKPCPCCGGKAELSKGYAAENVWQHGEFHRVYCGVCQLRQLFHRTPESAASAWNRRAASPADQVRDARAVPAGWKINPDEGGWSVVSPSGDGCYLFDNDSLHGQTMEGAAVREVLRQLCSSLVYPDAAPSATPPAEGQA